MPAPPVAHRAYPWLTSLKGAQLQRLARATGIQSSGTRAVLIDRVGSALHDHECQSSTRPRSEASRRPGPEHTPSLETATHRVLSIDMGVRNFAFAHFESRPEGRGWSAMPELTAWRRLAVSEIGEVEGVSGAEAGVDLSRLGAAETGELTSSEGDEKENEQQLEKKADGDKYEPYVYAATAYTLVNTLLTTYRPTHILIERQRFRSGGSKVVLEWSLRVGVLESMLYAVLRTLREERGGEMARVYVQGVEPKRVVQYWVDRAKSGSGSGLEIPGEKITAKQMKKAKIDLVGRWLDGSVGMGADPGTGKGKVLVGSDPAVQDLVDGYVRKWKSPRSRSTGLVSAGKLDDLADCLLQGMTWMEWQATRERLVREGEKALPSIL